MGSRIRGLLRGGAAVGLFAVSYDLVKKKDYQPLWDELERLRAHRALLSLYLVNLTDEDTDQVRDHFAKFIDADDRLLVVKLSDAAAKNCFKGTYAWINAHCP